MALSESQARQIRQKVLYSDLDGSFNKYLDVLNKVSSISETILNGKLNVSTGNNDKGGTPPVFSKEYIDELKGSVSIRYLDAQSSIEVKKIAFENWQQSCEQSKESSENTTKNVLPELKELCLRLNKGKSRLRALNDTIRMINSETETLSERKTVLVLPQTEWEKELGKEITTKLISKGYLKLDSTGSHGASNVRKYRVYDNFSKGPREVKRINKTMKANIDRLTEELQSYKEKWLRDADIFTKISTVLKEEIAKRTNKGVAGPDRAGSEGRLDEEGGEDEEDEEDEEEGGEEEEERDQEEGEKRYGKRQEDYEADEDLDEDKEGSVISSVEDADEDMVGSDVPIGGEEEVADEIGNDNTYPKGPELDTVPEEEVGTGVGEFYDQDSAEKRESVVQEVTSPEVQENPEDTRANSDANDVVMGDPKTTGDDESASPEVSEV